MNLISSETLNPDCHGLNACAHAPNSNGEILTFSVLENRALMKEFIPLKEETQKDDFSLSHVRMQ